MSDNSSWGIQDDANHNRKSTEREIELNKNTKDKVKIFPI